MRKVAIGKDRFIGDGYPAYIIAEIGINHNGSIDIAKKLIDAAVVVGCDAVKFQKRTPEICVPRDQWDKERDTPWGKMTYIEYKHKIEFGAKEFAEIDAYCKQHHIDWFASCWDEPSVDFMEQFNPVMYKMASASLTDLPLLDKVKATGKPLMISTGMSTMDEITTVINHIGLDKLMIAHSTSAYPCNPKELNLRMIVTLRQLYPDTPIGYSGHETGLATTEATIPLGANFIERHFTLDRAMWGTDHAASVEPDGMKRLVRNIRDIETALGDGVKKVYDSELEPIKRLRRVKLNP
ncbi:MAG: N-acetylneuraminate synthase family protein [Flavobacteriales bacterium]|nr:N-acetylneuraminate synthase family protein [Flavobacteriales bacterium]